VKRTQPAAGADDDAVYVPPLPEHEESIQHSLFGEILDWMLAPLLLLWPMSIAITYLVAKSIANSRSTTRSRTASPCWPSR